MMNVKFVGTELESCSESMAAAVCVAAQQRSAAGASGVGSGDLVSRMQSNAQQFRNDGQSKESFVAMNQLRKYVVSVT